MRLFTISLASALLGVLLLYGTLRLSEAIAEATTPRIEITLDQ